MEPLDQNRSIDAHKLNHTTKVLNKSVPQGSILERLMNFAASVPDFRRCDKGNLRHRLQDIIILMILGRTCGHVGRSDIMEFGNHNLNKFRKMGMLKNGVTRVRDKEHHKKLNRQLEKVADSFGNITDI